MASLYRKYRSTSFDDLVGQDHVTRTLRNAVRTGHIAHAYLFTGPRGTGKTSTARILAKAVNCLHPVNGNPDNTCENCRAANEGRALDVLEIDAASNTSVDNVRELRERVGYAAGQGGYKVYIVDEVHRLSPAAFDAFLKTLEEPPSHVIFVFASTEPHKVPETITSRCQRFDFRRISPADTLDRLRHVSAQEGVPVSDEALMLVAQFARGSLRDALGLLDQVSAYARGQIEPQDVREALGLADPAVIARLSDALVTGELGAGLREFHQFCEAGGDPGQLSGQLTQYWRAVLVASAGAPLESGAVDPELRPQIESLSDRVSSDGALRVLEALSEADFGARYNVPPELGFEMRFVAASRSLGLPAESAPVHPTPAPAIDAPAPERVDGQADHDATDQGRVEPRAIKEEPLEPVSDPRPKRPAPADGVVGMWPEIVAGMRVQSRSLQAVLRSGYPLHAEDGEVTVGFLHRFHCDQFSPPDKRRMLEEVVREVTGVSYRIRCVQTTREEVERIRGTGTIPEDDGFIQEAEERLRAYHARQLGDTHS